MSRPELSPFDCNYFFVIKQKQMMTLCGGGYAIRYILSILAHNNNHGMVKTTKQSDSIKLWLVIHILPEHLRAS